MFWFTTWEISNCYKSLTFFCFWFKFQFFKVTKFLYHNGERPMPTVLTVPLHLSVFLFNCPCLERRQERERKAANVPLSHEKSLLQPSSSLRCLVVSLHFTFCTSITCAQTGPQNINGKFPKIHSSYFYVDVCLFQRQIYNNRGRLRSSPAGSFFKWLW